MRSMPRLPTAHQFNNRPVGVRPTRRSLFMIYEGRTEKDYFDRLRDNRLLKEGIYIQEIAKRGIDRDETDRCRMVEMAHDFILFRTLGKCTPRRYVTLVLNSFFFQFRGQLEYDNRTLIAHLREMREELLDSKYVYEATENGLIKDGSSLFKHISQECSNVFSVHFDMDDTDSLTGPERPMRSEDRVFVMFDRDFSSYFTHEMYDECLSRCGTLGYHPLISSPKFELWLMFHLDGVDIGSPTFRPSYNTHIAFEMVGAGDLDAQPGAPFEKYISDERFDAYYKDGIGRAVRFTENPTYFSDDPDCLEANHRLFTSDISLLKDHPGTNLGKFFRWILTEDSLQR